MNIKFLILAILSTLFIIYMSSIQDRSYLSVSSSTERIISNLLHIPAFAVLAFLWLKSFVGREYAKQSLSIILSVITGLILFSISDEIHQSFVPGRTASVLDVGLDIIGILFGSVIFKIITRFQAL